MLGLEDKFTLFRVDLTFAPGGKIPATFSIQSVTAQPYNSKEDYFRLGLELLFICVVAYSVSAIFVFFVLILAFFVAFWLMIGPLRSTGCWRGKKLFEIVP